MYVKKRGLPHCRSSWREWNKNTSRQRKTQPDGANGMTGKTVSGNRRAHDDRPQNELDAPPAASFARSSDRIELDNAVDETITIPKQAVVTGACRSIFFSITHALELLFKLFALIPFATQMPK
jgi:hypothetical protein